MRISVKTLLTDSLLYSTIGTILLADGVFSHNPVSITVGISLILLSCVLVLYHFRRKKDEGSVRNDIQTNK